MRTWPCGLQAWKKLFLPQFQKLQHGFSKSTYPKVPNHNDRLTSAGWPHYTPFSSWPITANSSWNEAYFCHFVHDATFFHHQIFYQILVESEGLSRYFSPIYSFPRIFRSIKAPRAKKNSKKLLIQHIWSIFRVILHINHWKYHR